MIVNLSKLVLVFIFIVWLFFGVGLFISSDDSTVTDEEFCSDVINENFTCGERLFLDPQDTNTGHIWVKEEQAEENITCEELSKGVALCTNNTTGKKSLVVEVLEV